MVDEINIARPLTMDEKRDITEIPERGNSGILDEFLVHLTRQRVKFQKEFKPFDSYGARIDFEDSIKNYINTINSAVDKSKVKKPGAFDFTPYGEPDRFELLSVEEVIEEKIAGNMNTKIPVITGKKYEYKSKAQGNGITIFVGAKDTDIVDKYVVATYKKETKGKVV